MVLSALLTWTAISARSEPGAKEPPFNVRICGEFRVQEGLLHLSVPGSFQADPIDIIIKPRRLPMGPYGEYEADIKEEVSRVVRAVLRDGADHNFNGCAYSNRIPFPTPEGGLEFAVHELVEKKIPK